MIRSFSYNKFFIALLLIFFIFFLSACNLNKDKKDNDANLVPTRLKIAACPTCYELIKDIQLDNYEIIPTMSTAESLLLLQNQEVDMILAGRTLKFDEPDLPHLLIKDGYSVLSAQEETIYLSELLDYIIYTDLNPQVVQSFFPAQVVNKVDDVYQYLDQGIIVTTWENTDYARASIVHLLENDGSRVELSRRPTVYCSQTCDQFAQDLVQILNR